VAYEILSNHSLVWVNAYLHLKKFTNKFLLLALQY